MKNVCYVSVIVLAVLLPLYLSGCGGSSDGDDMAESPTTGRLSLSVTDAPVDGATSVFVEFTGVEIQQASDERVNFDFPARQIDLLALAGGGSEIILNEVEVNAGHYEWIRLKVNAECDVLDSYIVIDSLSHSMWIPSGSQTGLKLHSGFDVPAGGAVDFTVDFDLRKSVNYPQGQGNCAGNYKLRPTLRIVDNTVIGSISGTVTQSLLEDISCTSGDAIYVFEGFDVIPDDIDNVDPDPITTANVEIIDLGGGVIEGSYRVDFMSAGDYTVAFTCQAEDDDPEVDESLTTPIVFLGAANVTVTESTETVHNF